MDDYRLTVTRKLFSTNRSFALTLPRCGSLNTVWQVHPEEIKKSWGKDSPCKVNRSTELEDKVATNGGWSKYQNRIPLFVAICRPRYLLCQLPQNYRQALNQHTATCPLPQRAGPATLPTMAFTQETLHSPHTACTRPTPVTPQNRIPP